MVLRARPKAGARTRAPPCARDGDPVVGGNVVPHTPQNWDADRHKRVSTCVGMRVQIWLRDALLSELDEKRGDVPRSRWISRLIERELEGAPGPTASKPVAGYELNADEIERLSPTGCSDHPDAGATQSRGRWWCAAPGCTRPARQK